MSQCCYCWTLHQKSLSFPHQFFLFSIYEPRQSFLFADSLHGQPGGGGGEGRGGEGRGGAVTEYWVNTVQLQCCEYEDLEVIRILVT